MPIKYIGRTTTFKGKTLWEIVGNLKNFGVGRMIVRSAFERYPEPCYMKIVNVEAEPNQEVRKVRVWVEKVFRGRKHPGLTEIYSTSYKADYRLIPKDEEDAYVKGICEGLEKTVSSAPSFFEERVVPSAINMPPLLVELNKAISKRKGINKEVIKTLPLKVRNGPANRAQVSDIDNEKITVFTEQLAAPRLYEGLKP